MPQSTHYVGLNAGDRYRTTVGCSDCGLTVDTLHESWQPEQPDPAVLLRFRWHSGNGRYLSRCRDCERAHVRRWRENRRAPAATLEAVESLGLSRRYGVELELIFPSTVSRHAIDDALAAAGLEGWYVKSDGSLSGYPGQGWEVVGPPLHGEDGLRQIRVACETAARLGAKPNRSCGLHVHHEARDLGLDDFKRLIANWSNAQDAIDGLVAPSRRRGGNQYCARLTSTDRRRVNETETVRGIGQRMSRYRALNFTSFPRYGTVEVRQHQGTVDAAKVAAWVKFGQAMVERARVAPLPRLADATALLDALGDLLDESTRRYLLGRAERLARRGNAAADAAVDMAETSEASDGMPF